MGGFSNIFKQKHRSLNILFYSKGLPSLNIYKFTALFFSNVLHVGDKMPEMQDFTVNFVLAVYTLY